MTKKTKLFDRGRFTVIKDWALDEYEVHERGEYVASFDTLEAAKMHIKAEQRRDAHDRSFGKRNNGNNKR